MMKNLRFRQLAAFILAGAVSGYAAQASAAGFAIIEHSAKGLGTAFAGGAASADDLSTVWFNPAGMTRIEGTQMETAGHFLIPSSEYSDGGSTINPLLGGGPLPGGPTKDAGVGAFVPNFYYVRELVPNLKFGLGVNAPFGLKTDYSEGWVGRYHAISSALKTVNINPGFAYKFDGGLSVGFGLSAQYIEARITNAIDKSGVCLGTFGAVPCAGVGLTTPANPATDGSIDLEADDISYGYNLGVLYELNPGTRIGLSYRSKISHTLEGDADFSNTGDLAALSAGAGSPGPFTDQSATAKIALPESFSVSGYHEFGPKVAVMADVTWTRWNRFQQLVINFENGHPQNVTPEEWNNSIRVSAGVSYAYNDRWTFRGGVAFDEEPIPNKNLRTPRIPGDDRVWLAIGASYEYSDKLSFDVGYTHLFVDDVPIDNVEVNTGHRLVGEYEASVDIFSAQLNYRFK